MKKQGIIFILLALVIFPAVTHAQVGLEALLIDFRGVLGLLPRIIFGLSSLYFFWGTGQFILNAGDSKLRQDGINKMIWGVVVLAVFISINGIIAMLTSLLD